MPGPWEALSVCSYCCLKGEFLECQSLTFKYKYKVLSPKQIDELFKVFYLIIEN